MPASPSPLLLSDAVDSYKFPFSIHVLGAVADVGAEQGVEARPLVVALEEAAGALAVQADEEVAVVVFEIGLYCISIQILKQISFSYYCIWLSSHLF